MNNPLQGILEDRLVLLITKRARRFGFRGQDLDEALQIVAIETLKFTFDEQRAQGAPEEAVVMKICDRQLWKLRRRENRHKTRVERLQQLKIPEEVDATDGDVAVALDGQECLQKLSATNRLVCKHLSEGRSFSEIAELLQISKSNVQARQRRIRRVFLQHGFGECAS